MRRIAAVGSIIAQIWGPAEGDSGFLPVNPALTASSTGVQAGSTADFDRSPRSDCRPAYPQHLRPRASGGSRFKHLHPPDIKGTGYVVDALEAALWAFHRSDSFREGALLAVNLGDDADTTGAIYGQIAGAHYGAETIPAPWRAKLTMLTEITSLADQLHDHAARGT